jgi:hypothetical protein
MRKSKLTLSAGLGSVPLLVSRAVALSPNLPVRQAPLDSHRRNRGGSAGAKRSANGAPAEGRSSRGVL